jgi:hypothetical protein
MRQQNSNGVGRVVEHRFEVVTVRLAFNPEAVA